MNTLDKIVVRYHDAIVGTLSMTHDNKLCAFEYAGSWLEEGFSISPLELPLKQGLFIAKPVPFAGNFGVFEDSMPDGYGRYLLHKALLSKGIDDRNLTALDRLGFVGTNGMGALTYEPATNIGVNEDITDFDLLQQKALEVLREQQDTDAGLLLYNSGNSGGCRPKAVFKDSDGHWLIKFRHTYDPQDMGKEEFLYNETARKCGIDVPDFKLTNGKYFTTKRFDISADGTRHHVITAGGLLCTSISQPTLDYSNLLALTGYITQNPKDVEEMFRRMVFNYLTDNKDDHCKNFSFIVKQDSSGHFKYCLAPAYDLTHCSEGYNGEHATSGNGTGHPTLSDFIKVGTNIKMKEHRCIEIFNDVRENCSSILKNNIK